MTVEPRVSVVTIFWNAERFLAEAIESVFAQTYPDWELLLVDDGSTDGSPAIAQRYAQAHASRVRYLTHSDHANHGMSAARNLGAAAARGEYLAFLDADDVWLTAKLAEQVTLLERYPEAGLVYGPTEWWYSWSGRAGDQGRDFVHPLGVPSDTLLQPPELLRRFLECEGISPCTCSLLVRRRVYEQVGGFEESFRGMYEDQVFCAKLCLEVPVFVSGACLARYRQHSHSACAIAQSTGGDQYARQHFLDWLAAYLAQQRVAAPSLWEALRAQQKRRRRSLVAPVLRRTRQLAQLIRMFHVAIEDQPPFSPDARQRTRLAVVGDYWQVIGTGRSPPKRGFVRFRDLAMRTRAVSLKWLSLPVARQVRLTRLRRLEPLGAGRQRGTPIVRYYWSRYLDEHRNDIHGRALEIGTTQTIRKYGARRISQADAMDLASHSPEVTVVADLSRADHLESDVYDCIVNQFTMHVIYDVEAALYHSIRLLKPGGVLLVNFPCLDSEFPSGLDMGTSGPLFVHHWFTVVQVHNLLRRVGLTSSDYAVKTFGNVFARVAYQMNLPAEELTRRELGYVDPTQPLLICVRVVKPEGWRAEPPAYRDPWLPEGKSIVWSPTHGHYGDSGHET